MPTLTKINVVWRFVNLLGGFGGVRVSTMTGSEMSYPALARLIGRPESTGGQIIVSTINVAAAQRRAAAAMSVAMTKGDVEGVLAALRLLGLRAVDRGVCIPQVQSLDYSG